MKNIVLIGGGSHCKSVIEIIEESKSFKISGISDLKEKIGTNILDYKISIVDKELEKVYPKTKHAFITHGKNLKLRKKIFETASKIGFCFPKIVSSHSFCSKYCKISDGTIIMKGAIANSSSEIGKNCIINSGAIIEHDCKIGDHVHISPGAVISGNAKIGNVTHVGTNATVIDGIQIGNNSIIGAGAVIVKDVPDNSVVVGNPGREIKKNGE